MTITTHELLSSYNRTLLAKCQMVEFQSWGGTVVEACKKQIAAHQELEDRYIAQMMTTRADGLSGSRSRSEGDAYKL